MADGLENLSFQVILDHKDFDREVEKVKRIANDLNKEVAKALKLKQSVASANNELVLDEEKIKQATAKTAQEQQKIATEKAKTQLQQQKIKTEVEKTKKAQQGVTGAVTQTNTTLLTTSSLMRTISQLTGVAFSVVGIRRFLSSLVEITGQFEVQKMALRNMLQDIDAADKIYQDLYRFSSDSTYRFSELAKYAKQLAAFNIDKSNLLETTKMLGDVASGVGVSMDRIILAYGHVKSSGFLRGIQLRSFAQNGVPVLEELAKQFSEIEKRTVSLGEIFDKMMKRQIPFEMVEQAFKNMTSEGGKFYQMQEVLARTLAGQINILKGRWENMLAALGQANSGVLKNTVKGVSNLISSLENVGKAIKGLITGFTAYQIALVGLTWATEGLAAATQVGLLGALRKVGAWILTNPLAILATTIGILATSFYKASKEVNALANIQQTSKRVINDFCVALSSERDELDALYQRLKFAKKGTEEYDIAKRALESRFGPYIEELRAEGREVQDLGRLYDGLAEKITASQQARFRETGMQDIIKSYNDATAKIERAFDIVVSRMESSLGRTLSAKEKQALRTRITGGINAENLGDWLDVFTNDEFFGKGLQANLIKGTMGAAKKGLFGSTFLAEQKAVQDALKMGGKSGDMDITAWDAIKAFSQAWENAGKEYAKSMSDAQKWFGTGNKSMDDTTKDSETLTYKISDIVALIKKDDADIAKLRAKAKKEGLTVNKDLEIDEKQELDNLLADRKKWADIYESIMGVKYDRDKKTKETAAERARKEEIQDLKMQIALLERYMSIYEKIEPIMGENTASWMAEKLGGSAEDYQNLDEQIKPLIENLRKLGDEGKQAADAIEARLGMDEAGKLVKAAKDEAKAVKEADKALKQYLSSLDKLAKKGGDTEFDGVAHKVAKAIDKYNDSVKEANDEYTKGSDALGKTGITDPTELAEKTAALVAARNNLIATAKNTLKNDVGGLDDALFKELMSGFDLSNWNDKTYSQIEAIRTALGAVKVPDAIREMLSKTPEGQTALDALDAALQKLVDDMNNNTVDPEWWKKVGKEIRKVAKDFSKVAEAAVEYGEVIGEDWGKALDTMKDMGETLAVMAERWVKEDWIGVASAGLSFLIAKLIEAATEAKRLEIRLSDLQEQARHATIMGAISNIGESIFGTNDLEKLRQGMEGVNDALERMNELASKGFYGKTVVKGQSSGNWFLDFLSLFNNGDHRTAYDSVVSTWFSDIEHALSAYKLPIFDENGILNRDSLEALKELVPDEASDIQKLINAIDEYYAALEQVEGVMSDLVGDIADEAASKLIDQWVEAGNAALDYADILDDVARSYAQMVLKDMILNAMPKDLAKNLTALAVTGDNENFMKTLAEAMEGIKGMEPYFQQVLEAFDPYFNRDDEESGSLGKGIKSITEETASLLASYLNAIRADVSYMRSMAESGWLNVESIAGVVTPKLADYVQQIEVNTFNTAERTQDVLLELRSVIGTPDTDGMVVRVQQM